MGNSPRTMRNRLLSLPRAVSTVNLTAVRAGSQRSPNRFLLLYQRSFNSIPSPFYPHWHSHRFGDIGSDPSYNKSCLAVWKTMSRIADRVGEHLEFLWFVTVCVWIPLSSRCEFSLVHGGRDSDPLHAHAHMALILRSGLITHTYMC